jgi:hypothetical protein
MPVLVEITLKQAETVAGYDRHIPVAKFLPFSRVFGRKSMEPIAETIDLECTMSFETDFV